VILYSALHRNDVQNLYSNASNGRIKCAARKKISTTDFIISTGKNKRYLLKYSTANILACQISNKTKQKNRTKLKQKNIP
jgi:hypothetical protein